MSCRRSLPSRAVLFDLDGTLVDSFAGIADAYRHVTSKMGLVEIDDVNLRPLIGPPIQVALGQHFGLNGAPLEEAVRIFREHYGALGVFRYSKYPGIEEMLLALHDEGLGLYIATSKLATVAADLVEHAGWTSLFNVVGGADPGGTRYLKRDVIAWTMTQVTAGSHVLAMVGDRAADIVGGRQLGLDGIGVTWGYGSFQELDEAGATVTTDSPSQLPSILRGLG
jgi:phosphoglycolate phosphatase